MLGNKQKVKRENKETESNTHSVKHRTSIKNKQPNPVTLAGLSIFFFLINYIASQKTLPKFVSWLLIIIPLLLLATSFYIWARRKQFPFLSFPFDPIFSGNVINNEKNNVAHAVIGLITCVFFMILFTYIYLFAK
jgi:hypothetical protein